MTYTAYQARTQWYMDHWGLPESVREAVMEDERTKLGVMIFPAATPGRAGRRCWTYATNGMSERRMPCIEEPHGDPGHRLELVAYAQRPADWVADLLIEIARYPFHHRSGLVIGHTMPVIPQPGNLWSGYLLLWPRLEPEEFNPLAIDCGMGGDWVFFAEVMGLLDDELQHAIAIGGLAFAEEVLRGHALTPLDVQRPSVLRRDA